jgi:hypothetical protein
MNPILPTVDTPPRGGGSVDTKVFNATSLATWPPRTTGAAAADFSLLKRTMETL